MVFHSRWKPRPLINTIYYLVITICFILPLYFLYIGIEYKKKPVHPADLKVQTVITLGFLGLSIYHYNRTRYFEGFVLKGITFSLNCILLGYLYYNLSK